MESLRNRVLLALPAAARGQIMNHCVHVEFRSGHTLYLAEAPIEHVYFVESGLVSLIKVMQNGRRAEIGAVGSEGLVGLFAGHGSASAFAEHVVQVPVSAWRISVTAMRREMAGNALVRDAVAEYALLLIDQIAQTAACSQLHSLEQRCCRWLAMAHDNALADQFLVTHDLLASLLAVRRPSVSLVAKRLQLKGLIHYRHGRITILDRAGVEQASCECYRLMRRNIARAFRPQAA